MFNIIFLIILLMTIYVLLRCHLWLGTERELGKSWSRSSLWPQRRLKTWNAYSANDTSSNKCHRSRIYSKVSFVLSGLSRLRGGEETFLLVSAALANLTFMSPVTSTAMRQHQTVKILVKAVRAAPFTTLFAKDQASTESLDCECANNPPHEWEAKIC